MPATAYLSLGSFGALTVAPAEVLAEVEARYSGWIAAQLLSYSAQIDARLAKRYATPFDATNPPAAVVNWLARLVTPRVYFKRGVDPADRQFQALIDDADRVWAELKEAADAQNGLYDLPLRSDTDASGISKCRVRTRSDPDPYAGTDRQAATYAITSQVGVL